MKVFFVGLQFLTRLKIVNQTEWKVEDFGASVTYFPLVGLVIGAFMWALYALTNPYLPISLLMLILVIFEFLFTRLDFMQMDLWIPVTVYFRSRSRT